jgi:hypothetical protein
MPGISTGSLDLPLSTATPISPPRKRIKELAEVRIRHGRQRIHVLLRTQGGR